MKRKPTMNVAEAAEKIGTSKQTMLKMAQDGTLPAQQLRLAMEPPTTEEWNAVLGPPKKAEAVRPSASSVRAAIALLSGALKLLELEGGE